MNRYRASSQIASEQNVYIELGRDYLASVPMDGQPLTIERTTDNKRPYIKISLDRKLLKRILSGPRFAHWNNADIGSHLRYFRHPDIFDRRVVDAINFFHS
jgi:UDP-MurNAc hydroxylase